MLIYDDNGLYIEYELIDDSFTNEFGIEHKQSFKIIECSIYVEALKDWIDSNSIKSDKLNQIIAQTLTKHINNED